MAANEAAKATALWDMKRQRLESLARCIADVDQALTKDVLHVMWCTEGPGDAAEQAGGVVEQAEATVRRLVGAMSPQRLRVYETMHDVVRRLHHLWTMRRALEAQVWTELCRYALMNGCTG